jgi:choline dehydrogenase-like flavoprotein
MKAVYAPKGFAHPDRLLYPLKRVGERGSGKFERVSWDEANADIGARLKTVIDAHGPEALAVSTSDWNTSTENGATRRFMNLLGSPNYISGVALCAGNTAAVNRLVYGWFPQPDYANTNCIMLSDSTGHIMGGTRMHPDPKLGVVDQNLKVHGVPNLHIASSSVFPSGGYANPTFTILALAIRLADHIKARRAAGQIAA